MINRSDKIIGCILGGAVGDCLGGPYEGSSSAPVMMHDQYEWRLSDDTQMTLATCEAIYKRTRVDPAVIADTFATWFKSSRITGIGAATYKALSELSHGGHWALVGMRGEMAAGNGAAMRIAPLAFCLDPKEHEARVLIRDVSRITHHNEEAYAGALAVVLAVLAWRATDGFSAKLPAVQRRGRRRPVATDTAGLRADEQRELDKPRVVAGREYGLEIIRSLRPTTALNSSLKTSSLSPGQIDEDDIRVLAHPVEENLPAVR